MPKRASVARYTAALDIDMYEAKSQREVLASSSFSRLQSDTGINHQANGTGENLQGEGINLKEAAMRRQPLFLN